MPLIVLIIISLSQELFSVDKANISCSVFPEQGADQPFVLGSPLRLVVIVSNNSNSPFTIFSSGPAQIFSVECQMSDGKPLPAVPPDQTQSKPMTTTVAPGQKYSRSVYLNNYHTFAYDGQFTASWKITIPIISGLDVDSLEFEGAFRATIVKDFNDNASKIMDKMLSFFMNSDDPIVKREMLEGISSVRLESTLPYLEKCINSPGSEAVVVLAIGNRWPTSPMAHDILDRFMLTSKNEHALHIAVRMAIEGKRLLSNEVLQRFLQSDDPHIYDCGTSYVKSILAQLRLDLIDQNAGKSEVHSKVSQPIIELLQDTLRKNPSLQNKEKTTGNGF